MRKLVLALRIGSIGCDMYTVLGLDNCGMYAIVLMRKLIEGR